MDQIKKIPEVTIKNESDLDELVEAIATFESDLMACSNNRGPLTPKEEKAVEKHLDSIEDAYDSLLGAKAQENKNDKPSHTTLQKIQLACKKLELLQKYFENVQDWNSGAAATTGTN
ncbi:hypothetical protein F4814DRAFT_445913 [Daldinia grandis]|nr:hypothetical protein F4814DRAFT_445913 [Daldinia grandis]